MDHQPFIDPAAALMDERRPLDGIWPCTGRRRHAQNEWDDYTSLFDSQTVVIDGVELAVVHTAEEFECPHCDSTSPTYRGLTVHLSRTHGEKSERAEYYQKRAVA